MERTIFNYNLLYQINDDINLWMNRITGAMDMIIAYVMSWFMFKDKDANGRRIECKENEFLLFKEIGKWFGTLLPSFL